MRWWSVPIPLILVATACAGASTDGTTTDVEVITGVDLGLTAADRLEKSFTPGVWTAEREGDVVRLEISFFIGDEGGLTRSLELDFGSGFPELRGGALEYYDAYDDDRIIPVDSGVLELQEADPDGVIAGRWIGETDAMIRFWVDLADHTHAEIEINQPFSLRSGGYATWNESTVFQFGAVTEDSRCPPDVTCVWEGRLAIEGKVWDIEDERIVRLRGLATDGGPVYGTQPSGRFRNGLDISLIGLDATGLATFVVTRSN